MMKVHLPVFSMTSLFWCVFVSIFLVNTLVSVPFPLPNQIEILLAFKKEFLSPTCSPTVLSSWTKNTRSFDGVVFDNETGVVTELHLSEACLKGTIKNNSNLFKFHHLRYLDLSYNHFEDSFPSEFGNHFEEYSFPSEFGGLANLEFLNFRYSGLVGEVPLSIHNLSRLTFLDLSQNDLTGGFPLIYNLSKLSYLDLSYNNFIGTIPSSLLTMPSLLNLDLRQNGLRDPPENLNSSSSSKLERLYLGGNLFSGRILEPISKLVKLTSLDLSFLNMIYPINIVFLPLKSLEYLDLSGNTLSRLNTSSTDHALPKLVELKLSYCNIFEFPKFLMTLQSLEYLDLSWNNLLRLNTSSYHALTKLIELNLSNCSISEFPNLSKTLNLQHLDISNNRLKGKVPAWLWTLPVTRLSLSHNSLNGFEGSREVLVNSSLEMLDLMSNTFGGPFPILPPTINYVVASNNNFTGELPLSLCNPRKLSVLDLSSNNFSGPIPGCLGDSINGVMNLRKNNLNGNLPHELCRSGSLTTIDVGHNQISGKLPRSLVNCKSLEVLNVENNQINETFPFWLKYLPNLKVLVLRSNRFYGPIYSPQYPLTFSKLRIIDISRNMFDGSLPPNYFVNWSAAISSSSRLEYGRPRVKLLNTYGSIDFSGNRFGGEIPESIGLLKSLLALNLSNNGFTGHIPSSLANLTELESLDISRNQLSGTIPQELGKLSFLSYINMSFNKLTGEIPQGTQFQTQNESAFEGNIDLCGFPLQKSCSMANVSSHASKPMHNLNSRKPLLLFSFLIVFHFVLSFSFPLSTSL
ncbi:receptor like protein 27 isoform X1 [Brassica rapa]|uniref:receptor like protein 27 isoform X1 n=1 Tax=Brassica campestris TaxID=3711 RepID=UPI00142E650F|nr:receptor like protein 27 isoform X1 [Brassica rapa]